MVKYFLKLLFLAGKPKRHTRRGYMKKSKKKDLSKLNKEEEEILSSFERGEWKTIKNIEKEKLSARRTAARTLRKDVRINIRLTSHDLSNIKSIAAFEGIPYQTLIASVLHKYAKRRYKTTIDWKNHEKCTVLS